MHLKVGFLSCLTFLMGAVTALKPCSNVECLNGGTCYTAFDPSASAPYICLCTHLYAGSHCQSYTNGTVTPFINLCASNPCQHGATCVNPTDPETGSLVCQCAPGYVGHFCNREDTGRGDCFPNPCMNGGLCNPTPFAVNGYTCECQHGFMGDRCDQPILGTYDDCASSPCLNGGTCVNQYPSNAFRCDCQHGYSGEHCEVKGPCVDNPCSNGGTCLAEGVGYRCTCAARFYSVNCTEEVQENPCSPSPCQNGAHCFQLMQTEDTINSAPFYCRCLAGFIGVTCQDIDACVPNPCLNGGTCRRSPVGADENNESSFSCDCNAGFVGTVCSLPAPVFDVCHSNPCQNNATCTPTGSGLSCACIKEFVGNFCQFRDPCLSNPCMNNGQCYISAVGDSYFCYCQIPYIGDQCGTIVPCLSQPCQNGGACNNVGNHYECKCTDDFLGLNCDQENLCSLLPCNNGGKCYLSVDATSYYCLCKPGFAGVHCDMSTEEGADSTPNTPDQITTPAQVTTRAGNVCDLNPCASGSTCVVEGPDETGRYFFMCLCPDGYHGITCAIKLPPLATNQPPTHQYASNITRPTMTPPSACVSAPCQNGGLCVDDLFDFNCVCPTYFVGTLCDTDIRDCSYNDEVYKEGQSRINRCETCHCVNGAWQCTANVCECYVGDNTYMNNDTWQEDCNTCACRNGVSVCTDIDCDTLCLFEGRLYGKGDQRDERCSTCICQFSRWYCADLEGCVDNSCVYGGTAFEEDSIRPQSCNLCTCESKQWSCSASSCDEYPMANQISFEFTGEVSVIREKENEFLSNFSTETTSMYHLQNDQLNDIQLFPGFTEHSLRLQFNVVRNDTVDISVEIVTILMEREVVSGSYVLVFEGRTYNVVTSSFTADKIDLQDERPERYTDSESLNVSAIIGAILALSFVIFVGAIVFVYQRYRPHSSQDDSSNVNVPFSLQEFRGSDSLPESPPPLSPRERSLTMPAHYRFKNPFI